MLCIYIMVVTVVLDQDLDRKSVLNYWVSEIYTLWKKNSWFIWWLQLCDYPPIQSHVRVLVKRFVGGESSISSHSIHKILY